MLFLASERLCGRIQFCMARPFICLGDRTDHGGTVIEADMTFDIHGKPVALVGHKVVCRKCKGTFPITTGTEDMSSFGMAVARHGDKTACGATLLASQATSTWSAESSMGGQATSAEGAAAGALQGLVAPQTPTLCLECLLDAASRGSAMVPRG
jgi:uncharacterized Zn-binding protein involved in type VI secretion